MRQTACARRFLPAMIGGGTWEGAHARHEAAGVRQPARRRGGRVAARRRGRSRASGCGALACSELQMMSKHNHGLAFWSGGFKNWDGRMAETCKSITALALWAERAICRFWRKSSSISTPI